jgi:tRNA(Ile2) C34 agmatinyltransferase TiaS
LTRKETMMSDPKKATIEVRVGELEELLGVEPSAALGTPGRGVLGSLAALIGKVDGLVAELVADRVARAEAAADRRRAWLLVLKLAAPAVVLVTAVVHFVGQVHH